jgi:predicted NBD/HSP70 family sugar kinase
MYLAIDIGGTKTLIATFDDHGTITEQYKFLTPQDYRQFIKELAKNVATLSAKKFKSACVALPGRINRETGVGVACGNLPWKNVPIKKDLEAFIGCPVVVENDANLAALSEAIELKDKYTKVLYVTVSTGIGAGLIIDQQIDPDFADTEGGHIVLEHNGRRQRWERFASGSAIVRRFGKRAVDIHDVKTWRLISRSISTGLMDLIAVLQPEVIVIGGGVGQFFERFKPYVKEELDKYNTPLTPVPPLRKAKRPNEAVVYGCYHLARTYAHARTITPTAHA